LLTNGSSAAEAQGVLFLIFGGAWLLVVLLIVLMFRGASQGSRSLDRSLEGRAADAQADAARRTQDEYEYGSGARRAGDSAMFAGIEMPPVWRDRLVGDSDY
jgi:hypothetical protein